MSASPSTPIGWRRWRPTMPAGRRRTSDRMKTIERGTKLMALEVLVVDDEADIRELVSGRARGRGLCGAHRRRQHGGARSDRGTAPVAGAARRLAAGLAARRAAVARGDQAPRPDPAGADDLGPRQSRHRRRRDPRRRGRLHRKAVRGRAGCSISSTARPRPTGCGARMPTLRQQVGQDDQLNGSSVAINTVRATLKRVAPTGSRVLITGPAGVGKEIAARMIHQWSPRAKAPVHRRLGGDDEPRAGRGGIVRQREPTASPGPACSSRRMAAPCSSTRSPTCR